MILHSIGTNDITDISTKIPKYVIGEQIDLKNICSCSNSAAESKYYREGT